MTYEQIWNLVEYLFNQNLSLYKDANIFFGFEYSQSEMVTKDGLIIKFYKWRPNYI
jgi:hypothetical protein